MFINYFCLAFDWFLTIRRVRVAMVQSCNVDRVAATVLGISLGLPSNLSQFNKLLYQFRIAEEVLKKKPVAFPLILK